MGQAEDARGPGAPDEMDEIEQKVRTEEFGTSAKAIDERSATNVALKERNKAPPTGSAAADGADLTTKIFEFLSTATPGTLGGVAVGLAAITYFILGKVGLLLIGAFGGVVLFVQWEQRNAEVSRAVKGETGFDILNRILEASTTESRRTISNEADPDEEERTLLRSFDHFPPETREALNEFVDAVIRDYVKWWYSPIVPSDKFFPLSCRRTLTSFLTVIASHLSRKRPADAFLDFLTNSSSIVIVFFSELSNAFTGLSTDSKVSAADAIYNYLAAQPDSNLSNLLNQKQQAAKFRMVSEDLLGFLDRPTYECDAAKVFLREVLAGVVLEMTLQVCSKPEWINSWIVYLLEAGEPDFSQVIDVGMQTGPSSETTFLDIDGNVGNIGVTKGHRNSFETEKTRRKDSLVHKKKLSKADEEMESAMEEMKRMNQMIADAAARRSRENLVGKDETGTVPGDSKSAHEASERLVGTLKRNADELEIQSETAEKHVTSVNGPELSESMDRLSVKETVSDGRSSKDEGIHTPATPRTAEDSSSQGSISNRGSGSQFTNFDQLVPPVSQEDGYSSSDEAARKPPSTLSLHNAAITVLDEPGDKGRIRSKPSWDYLIQIEPNTTAFPGWMIVRRYSDFETLHEVLRRIANISGATAFSEQHKALPSWKLHTRTSLRSELERYLKDACWYESLADCEGMKRFLEKDSLHLQKDNSRPGLQAFEAFGKNVLDVLTTAPLEGSKAVVGGVTGVLGNIGLGVQRKNTISAPTTSPLQDSTAASRLSMVNPVNGARKPRDSMDSQRSSIVSLQPSKNAPMERRPSHNSQGEVDMEGRRSSRGEVNWDRAPLPSARSSREHSRASSLAPLRSPSSISLDGMKLPPPPDMMNDDYESPISPKNHGSLPTHGRSMTSPNLNQKGFEVPLKGVKQKAPLTEQETRVAVELLFAVINELYTLSSAWNIRRTLLAAAKSFLLRPGNPSLISIQNLIQGSVIEANTSDAGIAAQLRKLRENTMPTDEERAAWPAEPTAEEKEKLRIKARKLLIQSGVPAALMGVMGQSATGDALGRIFDCLQVEEVARGLMFGILLQAVRTVTH